MKNRIAGMVLAVILLFSMVSVAFANDLEETAALVEAETAVEEEQESAVFYLDGEPLNDVVAQCIGGTYYVTLASMMSAIDPNAVVEDVSVKATLTVEAVVVTEQGESSEEEFAAEEAGEAEQETEPTVSAVPAAAQADMESAEDAEVVETAVAEVMDTLTLTAEVGDQYIVANGRYLYAESGVIALEGQVAVPVRLLAVALNMSVAYDSETGHVNLTGSGEIGYLEDGETYYDEESVYWLSRIIFSESGNQSMDGKIAVGNVVMSRVYDPSFPATIYDVIFQKNQFSPASSGSIYREPNTASVIAAKLVLDGAEVMGDALFFNRVGLKCYASKNRTFVATIGGHSFYA